MRDALAQGGTSLDALYVNVNGQSGYFARGLEAYGRGGEPCGRCGNLLSRATIGGRASHWCGRCQRRYSPRRAAVR
ncbi:zinc finger domain-containing protein [Demequina litorisediminis]